MLRLMLELGLVVLVSQGAGCSPELVIPADHLLLLFISLLIERGDRPLHLNVTRVARVI